MLGRPEQGRRVHQAPVHPPHRPRHLDAREKAVDRIGEAFAEAGHRLMDHLQRAAELVREPPVGRKAQHRRDQPVAGVAPLHQAEVLLDQASRELERRVVPGRESEALARYAVLDPAIDPPELLGKTPGQVVEQQRQQFPLPGAAFRQLAQHGAALLVEEPPALGELRGKALVDLDPFLEVERLDPHGEAPGAIEKGAIADHEPRLSHPSRGVKPARRGRRAAQVASLRPSVPTKRPLAGQRRTVVARMLTASSCSGRAPRGAAPAWTCAMAQAIAVTRHFRGPDTNFERGGLTDC